MYAIIKTGGKQYTVRPGDVIDVEKLPGGPGDRLALQVLFFTDGKKVVTDAAELAKISVTAEIVEHIKGDKQIVFKFKRRKGYKRTKGHRQQLTKICIVEVNGVTAEVSTEGKKSAGEKPEEAPEEETVEEKVEATPEPEPESVEEAPAEESAPEPEPVEEAPAEESAPEPEPEVEPEPEPEPAEEPAGELPDDLSTLTVAQLKELAGERGIKIPSSARKAEIVSIIEEAL